eukprot:4380274-Alexandrium_andersonii.AAC.1
MACHTTFRRRRIKGKGLLHTACHWRSQKRTWLKLKPTRGRDVQICQRRPQICIMTITVSMMIMMATATMAMATIMIMA